MAVIHAMIQAKTYLYPTHIHIPVLDLGPPPFCLRLCAPGVPQPRERIEGTAPRIALHALLEQPTRLFPRPRTIPTRTTCAGVIGRFRREREPDALGRRHEPCGRCGEDGWGDARGTDMRERGAEGHLYSLWVMIWIGWSREKSGSGRTSRVSKYWPTFSTNCSLRSSPSGSPASGESVWGRARRARDVLARERRWPMSCWGRVMPCLCQSHAGGGRKMTFSTLPRSCIWRAVRDEDQMGSAS